MDFAENPKPKTQDEIKSAHFLKRHFSLHPNDGYYWQKEDGQLVRYALDVISDDTIHDYHAVHHYTSLALHYYMGLGIINNHSEVSIFSNNCAVINAHDSAHLFRCRA